MRETEMSRLMCVAAIETLLPDLDPALKLENRALADCTEWATTNRAFLDCHSTISDSNEGRGVRMRIVSLVLNPELK